MTRSRTVLAAAVVVQVLMTLVVLHPSVLWFELPQARLWWPVTTVAWLPAMAALPRSALTPRALAVVVLAVTALLQVAAMTSSPQTSNDDLRYILDGKAQLAGIDPYHYAPNDPGLDRLHEPLLFTPAGTVPPPDPNKPDDPPCVNPAGCALLNRPTEHTIYPPVSEAAFVVVRVLSFGGHGGELAFQVAAGLGVLVLTGLLLDVARRRGRPGWGAAWCGWCPVVVFEMSQAAHIDWLGALLAVAALEAYRRRRPVWAGALLGAAVATKLYPALIAPAMLRRHPVKVVLAAGAVVVGGYLPHLVAVGHEVVGYLPGYLHEEGYNSGTRLLLLGHVVPNPFDTAVGAVVMAALALVCWRRADPDEPDVAATWFVGAAFLVATPGNGWYAVLLIGLMAMSGRWYWFPVAFGPSAVYLFGPQFAQQHVGDSFMYLGLALVSLALWRWAGPWSAPVDVRPTEPTAEPARRPR